MAGAFEGQPEGRASMVPNRLGGRARQSPLQILSVVITELVWAKAADNERTNIRFGTLHNPAIVAHKL